MELIKITICLFLQKNDYDKLFILTCWNFGLFLVKAIPELLFFFVLFAKWSNVRYTMAIHVLTSCNTTSKVVKKKKVIKEGTKDACSLLCYVACYAASHWKN